MTPKRSAVFTGNHSALVPGALALPPVFLTLIAKLLVFRNSNPQENVIKLLS